MDQEQLIAQVHPKVGQLTVDRDWLRESQSNWVFDLPARAGGSGSAGQCPIPVRVLELCRSSYYCEPWPETPENLALMRRLDELHPEHPEYGCGKLTVLLRQEGLTINRKRVGRLLRVMGTSSKHLLHLRTRFHGSGCARQLDAKLASLVAEGRKEPMRHRHTAWRHPC